MRKSLVYWHEVPHPEINPILYQLFVGLEDHWQTTTELESKVGVRAKYIPRYGHELVGRGLAEFQWMEWAEGTRLQFRRDPKAPDLST